MLMKLLDKVAYNIWQQDASTVDIYEIMTNLCYTVGETNIQEVVLQM